VPRRSWVDRGGGITPSALVKVSFHGDELEALKDEAGKVWVSLRRCCENLGIDVDSQRKKLKGKGWACTVENTVHDSSGRQQQLTMIDLDTLPGWLFSIDARKVKEQVREKLARYQREAARVLADEIGRATLPTMTCDRRKRYVHNSVQPFPVLLPNRATP
jgi:hypothetical protein